MSPEEIAAMQDDTNDRLRELNRRLVEIAVPQHEHLARMAARVAACEPIEWCGRCTACGLPICNCPEPRCECSPAGDPS